MNLLEWRVSVPRREVNRLAWNRMRARTYAPDWKEPRRRFPVLRTRRIGDLVIVLCKYYDDYVVYTDLLMPGSYPCDSFVSTKKASLALFREIVAAEQKILGALGY